MARGGSRRYFRKSKLWDTCGRSSKQYASSPNRSSLFQEEDQRCVGTSRRWRTSSHPPPTTRFVRQRSSSCESSVVPHGLRTQTKLPSTRRSRKSPPPLISWFTPSRHTLLRAIAKRKCEKPKSDRSDASAKRWEIVPRWKA